MAIGELRPASREIDKPKCRACGVDMWLMRIEPRLDCDVLSFECSRCDAVERRETAPGQKSAVTQPSSAS